MGRGGIVEGNLKNDVPTPSILQGVGLAWILTLQLSSIQNRTVRFGGLLYI